MVEILKTQKYKLLITGSIFIAIMVVVIVFSFAHYVHIAKALDGSAGQPAHSHGGWPCLNCGSYSSGYISHLQKELNWLHANLAGFGISGYYPLTVNGSWNSATYNAVRIFQTHVGILVDGKVGNQTWSYMEFWVLTAPGITLDASAHPPGVTVKYPIYGKCRAITNNNSLSIAAPLRTRAEWDAMKAKAPNITNAPGDCSITTGGSGGSGGSGDDGGGVACQYFCRYPLCGILDPCGVSGCTQSSCAPSSPCVC